MQETPTTASGMGPLTRLCLSLLRVCAHRPVVETVGDLALEQFLAEKGRDLSVDRVCQVSHVTHTHTHTHTQHWDTMILTHSTGTQ